jgi:hypothetical protein
MAKDSSLERSSSATHALRFIHDFDKLNLGLEPLSMSAAKVIKAFYKYARVYRRYTSPDCNQDRSLYQDLAGDMTRRPSTAL